MGRRGIRVLAVVTAVLAVLIGTGVPSWAAPTTSPGPSGGRWRTERVCTAPAKPGYLDCLAIRRTPTAPDGSVQPASDPELVGYGPADLASAYHLPAGGDGMTVAIVDAFDDPTAESDLAVYRQQWDLPACTSANGCFTKIDQRGGTDYPQPDASWAGEISLDVDAVSAVCPRCHILLVEADAPTAEDLGTAVDEAVSKGAQVVSNSYGGPEAPDTVAAEKHFEHPGVAITASSGDDWYGVSFPASSPSVTSVGGTSLNRDDSTARGWTETVWNNPAGGPGSGCSAVENKPFFQTDTGCDHRTVADVSADADPFTGLAVYQTFGGTGWTQIGGTSLSSPIIAGVYALAGRVPADDSPNWYPYAASGGLNDVTSGANGTCDPAYLCTAGEGYDGPTGLGTPDGISAFTAPGPHGHVTGTVTDATNSAPLPNAKVTVTGAGKDATAVTDAAGHYDITLPTGDVTVAVSAFGYVGQTHAATVADGQAATLDVALEPEPRVTLSGTVADASGHGWPLYATVSAPDTPLPPVHTDPFTGRYTMKVPAHTTLSLNVTAEVTGYLPAGRTVNVGDADVTGDLGLRVDGEPCVAAGYEHRFTGLPAEPFEATSAPAGWTVADATGNGGWEFDRGAVLRRTNETTGSGNFALASSEIEENKDTTLTTPPVDLTGVAHPVVGMHTRIVGIQGNQEADIAVSVDGGTTWTTAWHHDESTNITGPFAVPIPQAAGHSGVLVRFHYVGNFGRYWELDDVYVGTRTCSPVTGGLVTGRVTDANTGEGVDGATVTVQSGATATSVATPDDDAVGDGYFAVFAKGTGAHRVTASARNRVDLTRTVQVSADALARTDFPLASGALRVTPDSASASVRLGDTGRATVTVTNTGTSTAHVSLVEQPSGDAASADRSAAASVPVKRVPRAASAARHPSGRTPRAAATRVAPLTAQPAGATATSWSPLADYPGGPIMDDAVVRGDDGKIYVAGGIHDGGTGPVAKAFVYDPARLLWSALPDLPVPVQQPAAAFLNGKLVLAGGWGALDAISDVQVYDPATGKWTAGTPMPEPRAAAGSAVLGGKLYVVGGCTIGDCLPTLSSVTVYDPARDRWSAAADYPAGAAFPSCGGGLDGTVVCAGGLALETNAPSRATYSYSPRTDTWTRLADLPTGWWGAATATANGQLLMSGGVAGDTAQSSAVTNQGNAYDVVAGTWNPLPNAPAPFYRGAAACGVYRVGGAADFFNTTPVTQELPGYDLCGPSGDVPWLGESSTSFTLRPGESTTVTLYLDASDAAAVDQPGDYTAAVAVRLDGPVQPEPIGVTMHVTPPKGWGRITGTVSGTDCAGTTAPLGDATVTVQGRKSTVTLTTDVDGTWSLWMDRRENPVTVVVSKDRFSSVVKTVKVRSGGTTTVDTTLKPARC